MTYQSESNELVPKIIRLIQTHRNPQTMLSEIAMIVAEDFAIDLCLIVAGTNPSQKLVSGFWTKNDSRGIPAETMTQLFNHPLMQNLLAQDQLIAIASQSDSSSLTNLLPVETLLVNPTEFQNQRNGFIFLGMNQAYQWTQKEQKILKMVANTIAIANFIVDQETIQESLTRESTATVNFLGTSRLLSGEGNPLMRKWYELTRQQLEQQRQLNQLKDDIITTISHEAGTPLASMKLAIQMLNSNGNLPPELQQRYWKILQEEWQRLNDLITNITALQQLQSEEISFNPQWVNINFLLEEVVQSFREQWQQERRKQLNLETEGQEQTWRVYTDSQHFRSIITELLTNAGKFAHPNSTVFLKLSESNIAGQAYLKVTITNQGLGISEAEKEHIFEPFHRGQGVTEKAIPGIGLGLALIKGLVELLGGKIDVASNPNDELDSYVTSFIFSIPKSPSS